MQQPECAEAGGRVSANVLVRDIVIALPDPIGEVIADGPTLPWSPLL